MKHLKVLVSSLILSFTLLTGCQKEIDSSIQPASVSQSDQLSVSARAKLKALRASLPAGSDAKLKEQSALLLKTDPQYRDMVRRAMALEPTPCSNNTVLNQWLDQQLVDWNDETFFYLGYTAMLDLPTYDALFFENSSANQTFGPRGEYTQRLTKTFKDLQRFWNIQSSDIVLAAMHGGMLRDRNKIIRTYTVVYGLDEADATYYADLVMLILEAFPELRNGDHPLFTFNAFAQEGFSIPSVGKIPSKIIMGDGIMQAYTGIGYEDVAPQAILAHEFGHQVQFQLNLFGSESTPEATRRTELMADAYSAYYLSHARGASMQWKRVRQFLQVFFNIGDCSFTSAGHHGTPTQRMAAAEWGYSIANNAQKQGQILTSQEFTKLFEAQLPLLVKQ